MPLSSGQPLPHVGMVFPLLAARGYHYFGPPPRQDYFPAPPRPAPATEAATAADAAVLTTNKGDKAAKKSPASRKANTTTDNSSPGIQAEEIYSGIPNDKNVEWSWEGWTKKTFRRMSGRTKGRKDNYWYTPQKNYQLRSFEECRRFNQALRIHNGDEAEAWKSFKEKK
jgi:hypothetical protein